MNAYVDFGYGKDLDARITSDGETLALAFTADQIENWQPEYDQQAYDLGVSDEHSGYSWGCMLSVAAVLVKNGWTRVSDIPSDHELNKRIVRN